MVDGTARPRARHVPGADRTPAGRPDAAAAAAAERAVDVARCGDQHGLRRTLGRELHGEPDARQGDRPRLVDGGDVRRHHQDGPAPGERAAGAASNAGTGLRQSDRRRPEVRIRLPAVAGPGAQPGPVADRSAGATAVTKLWSSAALVAIFFAVALGAQLRGTLHAAGEPDPRLPERLADTGLYLPNDPEAVSPELRAYSPQYPLWSDGLSKRRWVQLPNGGVIDGTDEHAWTFPPGTRFWKEFSLRG